MNQESLSVESCFPELRCPSHQSSVSEIIFFWPPKRALFNLIPTEVLFNFHVHRGSAQYSVRNAALGFLILEGM